MSTSLPGRLFHTHSFAGPRRAELDMPVLRCLQLYLIPLLGPISLAVSPTHRDTRIPKPLLKLNRQTS